tara:strand:- start:940 stop:1140 length:201 start_codon:yes stop_codon:yes gene_type:complete
MILAITKSNAHHLGHTIETHNLSNGGVAVIDICGKMVAYNKIGEPNGNNWDYVRKDYRMGVDKADK